MNPESSDDSPQWLQSLLTDPEITDICFNAQQVLFENAIGMQTLDSPPWSEQEIKQWMIRQLSLKQKTWDAKQPFVDLMLGQTHRMHAILPPLAHRGIEVSLRRLGRADRTKILKADLETRWPRHLNEIRRLLVAVQNQETILICGATGSGKTTFLNDLISHIDPSQRIIALEDTPELTPAHPNFVSLLSRSANADGFGEVTLRDLLKQTLRMRPDRILLGECRGDEVLDLLQINNTGHPGSMATLHANSCRDALRRIELLCLLASKGSIPSPVIRELIAGGLRWVVHLKRTRSDGQICRNISEISQVDGIESGQVLLRPFRPSPNLPTI